jgi:hypothetical protein
LKLNIQLQYFFKEFLMIGIEHRFCTEICIKYSKINIEYIYNFIWQIYQLISKFQLEFEKFVVKDLNFDWKLFVGKILYISFFW